MESAIELLKRYWHYSSFRPMQEEIIRAVMEGRDVLALLPTGGGKSVCFQVPALAKPGLCLVVSPLIALMKDQVEGLRRKNITAFALYAGMSWREVRSVLELAGNSNCKFLYVSPERLETAAFREWLPALPVSLVAIDEAHCVSQWGYDFRPPYLRIAALREELPGIPILALTASATPAVQGDIAEKLGLKDPVVYRSSFERPNLSYSVFRMGGEDAAGAVRDESRQAGEPVRRGRGKPGGAGPGRNGEEQEEGRGDQGEEKPVRDGAGHGGAARDGAEWIDRKRGDSAPGRDGERPGEEKKGGPADRIGGKTEKIEYGRGGGISVLEEKLRKIGEILRKVPGSAIVYCRSRKRAGEIAAVLESGGISASYYHAGLAAAQRAERQQAWMKDACRVMVCTNAFGMGIDKPDVRVVIHADLPDSVEAYYQEAGRAGRDGNKAYAVLLYEDRELEQLRAATDTRFPELDTIRGIYQSLMNFLQVPAAYGEGRYYDFDLEVFCRLFRLDRWLVASVLKVLEQEDLLAYQDQPWTPAKAQVMASRERMQEYEKEYPGSGALLHTLLRTYEGIADRPVGIYERQLAFLLRKTPEEVEEGLGRLQAARVIDYRPLRQEPLVYFFRDRPLAEHLYIDPLAYRQRKEQYLERVGKMFEYVGLESGCRSRWLAVYFGDEQAGDCGICDQCLRLGLGLRPGPRPRSRPPGKETGGE